MNVFLDRAQECGILGEGLETTDCRIWFADQCGYMRTRRLREAPVCELKGEYQEKNMQTAYVALQVLRNYTNYQLPITNKALSSGFAASVPSQVSEADGKRSANIRSSSAIPDITATVSST